MYLQSGSGTSFRGFMIQGRTVADDSPVGYFTSNSANYQPQCSDDVSVHIMHKTMHIMCSHYICRQLLLIQTILIRIL